MDFWLVAYNTGKTFIVRGNDLYDVHQWVNDEAVVAIIHLSKETVKKYAIDTIANM